MLNLALSLTSLIAVGLLFCRAFEEASGRKLHRAATTAGHTTGKIMGRVSSGLRRARAALVAIPDVSTCDHDHQ